MAATAHAQSVDYGSLQTLFNEPVTTSATGSPQRSTEAPADMQIITADEIRRSGETTISGILQRAAGIDVLNTTAGQSEVNVRGYNQLASPRLLVLVNGRQVYLDHYGLTTWAAIPVQLEEIRQIEVVKGPNSALFGFNAASGVINIITYNPKYDDTNIATLRGGLNGQREGSLVTTFKIGPNVSARLSVGGTSRDEWKPTGALPLASDLYDPASVKSNLDIVAQLAPKTELRVEGSWSNIQQDNNLGVGYGVIKMINASEKATLISETRWGLIQAQAYQNQLTSKYASRLGVTEWNNAITVASLQDLFKIGADHTFRVAAEYRHNTLNVAPIGGANISYDVWSGSGMWNWAINRQLTLTTALRVDDLKLSRSGSFAPNVALADNNHWNRDIVEPSINLTGAWRPTAYDTVKLSFARGIQAPSLIELGGVQTGIPVAPGFTLNLLGNPKLNPSIVTNYELAYDHDFMIAKIGARLFVQDWTDLKSNAQVTALDYLPTATTNGAFSFINVGASHEKGVELTATGKIADGLSWRADTTYTDVKDKLTTGVNAVARSVAFQDTTPKFRGNIGGDWEKGHWEADANLHYVSDYQFYSLLNGALVPVKAYTALSGRIGYKMDDGVILALSGQNLGSNRQKQTTGLEAERSMQFTITKTW
ncbi:TonB-dependent receptor plug domain-containing protein [Asticcacaulis benevestitus]|uniref:TonB-dependent receptor plug domain-containing protein n=1 Tax=Asticcacaulis benevestitus TaxID=347481 RepID=UPI00138AC801|nr:TonB-dependent receptor [Asticcacaulis benevestitus]